MVSLCLRSCWLVALLALTTRQNASTTPAQLAAVPGIDADAAWVESDPNSASDIPDVPWITAESQTLRRIYRITAYHDRGTTAAGVPSGIGQCAAPAEVPFGSVIYIPALGRSFIVTDRTHKRFRHNTVDVFIPDRSACLEFGLRYSECFVVLPAQPPGYGSPQLAAIVRRIAAQ